MVVPGGAAVKLDDPNKDPDVPPKGLDAVLVVPNNPPLLVLVPKLPKAAGLLAPNALFCWENSPPPPVLVLPKRLFDVPLVAPNPKPLLVEDVTG